MKITVMTPSVRPEGLEIVRQSLEKQDFPKEDFEWVVCTPAPFPPIFDTVSMAGGVRSRWIEERPKREGDFYNLTKAFNDVFKNAEGELCIMAVDLIWFPADTLTNFWNHYEENKRACVGAIGHQYDPESVEMGKPQVMIWKDPRARLDQGSFYEIYPIDFEMCLASMPRQMWVDAGGFDEDYDQVAALGEKDFCLRADKLGYKFYLDQAIEYRAIQHPRLNGKEVWDAKYEEGCKMFQDKIESLNNGSRSPSLDFSSLGVID